MSDKQLKRRALSLLKRARRWFNSEDRLVKDWANVFEDADGNNVGVDAGIRGACRACIVGGLQIARYRGRYDWAACSRAHAALLRGRRINLVSPHPLATVQRMYDRAIAGLEKELRR